MRRGREGKIWKDEKTGELIGISLGADYCAEHEWGIKGIKRLMGLTDLPIPNFKTTVAEKLLEFLSLKKPVVGLDRMKQTREVTIIHNLDTKGLKETSGWGHSKKKHTFWGFAVTDSRRAEYFDLDKSLNENYYNPEREDLIGYWCENDFAVLVEDKKIVEELVDAFNRMDTAVWVGASGPFKNGGLIIAIASRLPKEFVSEMTKADEDTIALQQAAAKTGIHKVLKDSGRSYFALSPKWTDESKTEVKFWLNPQDQSNNNYGYYTVEELEEWADGKGPIPKQGDH
jgi:hypothetical protein